MQTSLENLHMLIKKANPKSMSTSQFKDFSNQFRNLTYTLGRQKFQQYFDTKNQTIQNMQISYNANQNKKSTYQTDFTLLDSASQESHITLEEAASTSGFTSTYYQNLCYAYLEANKYSNINENL